MPAVISSMLESGNTQSLLLAAAVSLGCVGVGYHYGVVKRKQPRKSKTGCACGKVEIMIEQPPANYSYMDASCIQCTCTDCVGFCEEVLKKGSSKMTIQDLGQPGISTTVFYDSELTVLKGQEYLESMLLSEKSPNRRIYSNCCGTPIAIASTDAPINLVYCANFKPVEGYPGVNVTPFCCFHYRKGDPVPHKNFRMINRSFAPRSILDIVSRLGLLAFVGSYGPGSGIPVSADKKISIGMDSIKVNKS